MAQMPYFMQETKKLPVRFLGGLIIVIVQPAAYVGRNDLLKSLLAQDDPIPVISLQILPDLFLPPFPQQLYKIVPSARPQKEEFRVFTVPDDGNKRI